MTGKERILRTMKGEEVDRVPVSLFVQEEYLSHYFPDRQPDRVRDAVDCARELGFDVMTRSNIFSTPYFLKKSYPNWTVHREEFTKGGNYYRTYSVETPKLTLRQVEAGPDVGKAVTGLHLSTTEYLLKDADEVAAFIEYVPPLDSETELEVSQYCDWSRSLIGDLGIAAPWGMGGVYNLASTYMDVTKLMMDAYLDEDGYTAYMEKICSLAMSFDGFLASQNQEVVGIQGNIANGGMVGRDFFNDYILPYEKKLVEEIHRNGAMTVYHNCGKAAALCQSYVEMGLSAWETISEPPQGDNSLAEAKRLVGKNLTLIGNIDQVSFLKQANPHQVAERTKEIMATGKPGGRYIFAASDYLEPGTPLENVKAMIAAAKECGVYI